MMKSPGHKVPHMSSHDQYITILNTTYITIFLFHEDVTNDAFRDFIFDVLELGKSNGSAGCCCFGDVVMA
jgi:hypothetical protein